MKLSPNHSIPFFLLLHVIDNSRLGLVNSPFFLKMSWNVWSPSKIQTQRSNHHHLHIIYDLSFHSPLMKLSPHHSIPFLSWRDQLVKALGQCFIPNFPLDGFIWVSEAWFDGFPSRNKSTKKTPHRLCLAIFFLRGRSTGVYVTYFHVGSSQFVGRLLFISKYKFSSIKES